MNNEQQSELQRITRHYLSMLVPLAEKHGLFSWLKDIIDANNRGECSATKDEAQVLARLCDDERVTRQDIPKLLDRSYRNCVENEVFEQLPTLKRVGIYDKISVLLFKKSKK